jgi:Zn-dependent peptidase ImmA (M78 family)
MTLRRGFRTYAEEVAREIRSEMGLVPADRLDLRALAERRGIRTLSADELIDKERLIDLERMQAFAFSACTFDINGMKVIVVNPLRSPARQASDIAHELSHLLLKHELTEVREIAGVTFRTCRSDQEEEATTLGGTLLLPRPLLMRAVGRGMSVESIAKTYGVTSEMARFRFNTTGVSTQLHRARARRMSSV